MESYLVVFALLLFFRRFDLVSAGEYCSTYDSSSIFSYDIKYCDNGCCGSTTDAYCCPPIGAIIGGVIGGLFFIGIVVTIIICCKKHSRPGVVVQPANAGPSVIMATSHQPAGFHPQQQYPQMQQGYAMGGPAYPPAYPSNSHGQVPQPNLGPQNPHVYQGNEPQK